jgi:hypothetical protein
MSIENIISIYRLATPEEKKFGVTWYAIALTECERIAIDLQLPTNIVVGVVSALSPNNKWERNIENARDLCNAYINGEHMDSVKVSTYNKMKQKAWDILCKCNCDDDIIKALNGQKIVQFFQNIMGYDGCTVDGHAKGIYTGERFGLTTPKNTVTKSEYKEISEAYRLAGKKVRFQKRSLKAYEIQAITWLAWKRIHNI